MEGHKPSPTPEDPAPLGSAREALEAVTGFAVAAAKMVGRDVLHLLHIRRKDTPDYGPMSKEETGDWNNKHGFPRDWRN